MVHTDSFVSVIIPTYNRAEMLERALNSVLQQTFQAYEIIIVDDGSADQSGEVVNQIRSQHSNKTITYIKNRQKKGGAGSRNVGLHQARSSIVAFLDDDDEWLPEKLAKQLAILLHDDDLVGVSCSRFLIQYQDGKVKENAFIHEDRLNYKQMYNTKNLIGSCSFVLIRWDGRTFFDEKLTSAQDLDFWIRLARKSKKRFYIMKDILARYHDHESSKVTDLDNKWFVGQFRFIKKHLGIRIVPYLIQRSYLFIRLNVRHRFAPRVSG